MKTCLICPRLPATSLKSIILKAPTVILVAFLTVFCTTATLASTTPLNISFNSQHPGHSSIGANCQIDLTGPSNCPSDSSIFGNQLVYFSETEHNLDSKNIDILYESFDPTTTGIGFRVHFDSSLLTLNAVVDLFVSSNIASGNLEADTENYDGDSQTDYYLEFGWASIFGNFPGSNTAKLAELVLEYTPEPEPIIPNINNLTLIDLEITSRDAQKTGRAIDCEVFLIGSDNCNLPTNQNSEQAVYISSSYSDGNDKFITISYKSDTPTTTGIGFTVSFDNGIFVNEGTTLIHSSDNIAGGNPSTNGNTTSLSFGYASLFGAFPGSTQVDLAVIQLKLKDAQVISVEEKPIAILANDVDVPIIYQVTDNNASLSGLGLNIHFDSSVLTFNDYKEVFEKDYIFTTQPKDDINDIDNDPSTDKYLMAGWASVDGNWSGVLPQKLITVNFDVAEFTEKKLTNINFTSSDTAAGYSFIAQNYNMEIIPISWDFDGNGTADALTDGLLFLRYSFGLRSNDLTDSAVATDSPYTTLNIEQIFDNHQDVLDIDASNKISALTDGLLLLRYLFDITDYKLIEGVISNDATRTELNDIETYLKKHMP